MERQPGRGENGDWSGDTTLLTSVSGHHRSYLPGDIVDGTYQLTALLGRGGMGVVFACRHVIMDKNYAIKILSGDQLNEEAWNRFRQEAQALASLHHPGIVGIHNMGADGGQYPYYVMDLLDGYPLDELIDQKGKLSVKESLKIFIAVADALHSSHTRGIIHRDIKPSNIMILSASGGDSSKIKIVDFGIARLATKGYADQSQTKTGMIFGTPFYMSPEQCQGQKVDERSDIYSFGCALFESLTGTPPFKGENAFQTFLLHQTEPAPALVDVGKGVRFSDSLEASVAKMLAKRPANRYQSMAQLKHDLERIEAGKPIMTQAGGSTIMPIATGLRTTDDTNDSEQKPPFWTPLRLAITALVSLFFLSWSIYACYVFMRPAPIVDIAGEARDKNAIVSIFYNPKYLYFCEHQDDVKKMVSQYRKNPQTANTPFKRYQPQIGFQFPPDFIIGQIQIGDRPKADFATGFIPVQPTDRVCMYLTNFTTNWPEILDKFGPDDLTGLNIVTRNASLIVKKITGWHRLDELSFFNPLIHALPGKDNEARYDESVLHTADLALIDSVPHLKTLGLCGPTLNGTDIAKMQQIDWLESLRLKRITNIKALLAVLPGKKNLKELWLLRVDISDDDIKALSSLDNLQSLKIRSSKLTPASAAYFKQMKGLNNLCLVQEWSEDEKKQFQSVLPFCKYEDPGDITYWKIFPSQAD